jgi:two-component system NarL family sensor kinase
MLSLATPAVASGSAERERERLASRMHDGPLQDATALGLQLARLLRLIARDDHQAAGQVAAAANRTVLRATARLRDIVGSLEAPDLGRAGVLGAMRDHLLRLETTRGLEAWFDSSLEQEPDDAVAIALYRVAQEAVRNVVDHAQASTLHVHLYDDDGWTTLAVRDDGVGIDPRRRTAGTPDRGSGIAEMTDAVGALRGSLRIDDLGGHGTRVVAAVPAVAA